MTAPVNLGQQRTALTDLEAAVESSYATFAASARTPEVRQLVGLQAPFDCDDTLWIINRGLTTAPVTNFDQGERCTVLTQQLVRLELARCWPTPRDDGSIDADAERAAALGLAEDATVLWYGLGALRYAGQLLPSFPGIDECDAVRFGPMQAIPPGGDRAGWSWDLTIVHDVPVDL
jgi:hypothetical protein